MPQNVIFEWNCKNFLLGFSGENHQNGDDVKSANGDAEEDGKDQPRALHKTTSIFLRNLAPTITKAEVEAMCKRWQNRVSCEPKYTIDSSWLTVFETGSLSAIV